MAQNAAPPAPPADGGSSTNVGAIVGGVVGGVALVALVAVVAVIVARRRRGLSGGAIPGGASAGVKSGEAMYTSNPEFDAKDMEAGGTAAVPPLNTAAAVNTSANPMFDARGMDSPMVSARGAAAGGGAGVNALYDTSQSQLSEPDAALGGGGGYTPSDMSAPQSARSRLDSARSGLRSKPELVKNATFQESSDEDDFADAGNNPIYESARSGTDIMATAESDLPLDSARTYDSAPSTSRGGTSQYASARGSVGGSALGSARGAPASNPMFNADAAAEAPEGSNPLFQQKK